MGLNRRTMATKNDDSEQIKELMLAEARQMEAEGIHQEEIGRKKFVALAADRVMEKHFEALYQDKDFCRAAIKSYYFNRPLAKLREDSEEIEQFGPESKQSHDRFIAARELDLERAAMHAQAKQLLAKDAIGGQAGNELRALEARHLEHEAKKKRLLE